MWKRPRTWITLALLILLNIVAWDIRPLAMEMAGVIPLYSHQGETGIERIVLQPARFYFDSVWYSYAVALCIGFVLPFILAPLLPWLWRRRQQVARGVWRTVDSKKKRRIVAWIALLIACNVLAWKAIDSPVEYRGLITLSSRLLEGSNEYSILLPRWQIFSLSFSYALSILIGVGIPLAALWLWRRFRHGPGRSTSNPLQGGKVGAALATLVLLVSFNILAWDWAESREKDALFLVLEERETREDAGFRYYDVTHYSGIAPGIRFPSKGASVLASLFVGEILPFLLVTALFRRRQPPALPLPPVAGAPR